MKVVTVSEVMRIIREKTVGASMVTVELDSPMDGKGKMRTKGNPYAGKGVVKRETLNGVIGYIYENAVNRVADKEGKEEREAKIHPWGDMDEKHLFRIHRKNGKPYLSMKVERVSVHGFFLPDGTQIADEDIRPFIPEKTKSSTQADLEAEVIARDYGMENITSIRAWGEVYVIGTHIHVEQVKVLAEEPVDVSV